MITDLTKEHPNKTLWRFLLPMLFSVMFQQIYNIADSMIAGRFAGENALAAVGASYPITIIFMAFAVGMNLGASVVVSRLFGAEDRGGVKRAVTTAFLSSMVLGIMLTLFGYFFNHQMMRWIRTPQNIMADGIIRGSGAMVYFVVATVPDLILRIGFALVLTKSFGSTGIWMAWPFGWIVATTLTLIFYRKLGYKNDKSSDF